MVTIDRETAKEWLMREIELEQEVQAATSRLQDAGSQLKALGEALEHPEKVNISAPIVVRSSEEGGMQSVIEFDLQEMDRVRLSDIAEWLQLLQEKKQELADVKRKLYAIRNY